MEGPEIVKLQMRLFMTKGPHSSSCQQATTLWSHSVGKTWLCIMRILPYRGRPVANWRFALHTAKSEPKLWYLPVRIAQFHSLRDMLQVPRADKIDQLSLEIHTNRDNWSQYQSGHQTEDCILLIRGQNNNFLEMCWFDLYVPSTSFVLVG